MIQEATVNCYDDSEQHVGFLNALEEHLTLSSSVKCSGWTSQWKASSSPTMGS